MIGHLIEPAIKALIDTRNFNGAAQKPGCDDYDPKPIELPRLLEKIEKLLRQ